MLKRVLRRMAPLVVATVLCVGGPPLSCCGEEDRQVEAPAKTAALVEASCGTGDYDGLLF